ncbi:hypothetical protein B0T25DRAFT_573189 [Lasiosphaeria hispida]|uniref:Nephrocystin 3-like N-terminal domain-containing protein n=1 Tax=Lasiosphaeria hispida TaxID=260671 RepID=A0AAJ0H9E6_9PEZI|nr:hypothetical protein B0T25DRAFT_573189 [Lasiosphaeria hispida]
MEKKPHRNPAVPQQPPSVTFIQTRLAETLDAVKGAQVDYNPKVDRFEPRRTGTVMPPAEKARLEQDTPEGDTQKHVLPVRELVPAVEAMLFWNAILDQAMARFIYQNMPEPEKLAQKPEYSIRSKKKWEDIHDNLQNARNVFNGAGKAVQSRFKKFYRSLADSADSMQEVMVMVPDDGAYISLVKFVLGLLLDVVSVAAQTRIQLTGFADEDEMKRGFARVEIFLSAFPGDPNIKDASVNMIACVLKAVEGAIVYFLSSTVSRALKSLSAIGQGQNYKKDLIDSISEIPAKTKELMDRVEESHIWVTQKAMGVTLTNIEGLRLLSVENTKAIALKTDGIINKGSEIVLRVDSWGKVIRHQLQQFAQDQETRDVQLKADLQAVLMNAVKPLFDAYEKKTEEIRRDNKKNTEDLKQSYEKNTEDLRRDNKSLRQELEILKRRDHSAATSRAPSPEPEQRLQSQTQWPNNPHYAQTSFPPWQDPYAYPNPYHQNHYLAPPPTQHYTPPQAPAPPPPPPEPTIHVKALIEALNIARLDKDDMEHAFSLSESIPFEYRLRAQEIVRAREFQTWATATESRELLVEGDPGLEAVPAGAAVSLVAASLMAGLRARQRGFASLVFFCGRHTSRDDAHAGAGPMLRSLIAQLLEQHYANYTFRQSDVSLDRVRTGTDLDALCRLLEWLTKWLPSETTVVVVVDGIGDYEMGRFKDGMLVVLRCLLGLARNESPQPVVKVLATSPTGTVGLRSEFTKSASSLLLMEELQIVSETMDMPELEGQLR